MDTCTRTRRWSETIPPQTALSFAAVWDPDEGMVTFSGGKLLDSDAATARSTPRDVFDGQSQVLTLDCLTLPLPSAIALTESECKRGGPAVTFACDAHALDDAHSLVDPYFRRTYRVPVYSPHSEESAYSQSSAEHGNMPGTAEESQRKHTNRRQGAVQLDWMQLQAVGKQLYSVIVAPFERRSPPPSPTDESTVTDEGFFEEVPMTARTSTSAPVLVNLNLVSRVLLQKTGMALIYNHRRDLPSPSRQPPLLDTLTWTHPPSRRRATALDTSRRHTNTRNTPRRNRGRRCRA